MDLLFLPVVVVFLGTGVGDTAPWVSAEEVDSRGKPAEWQYTAQVSAGFGYGALYHGDNHQFSGGNFYGGFGIRPFRRALPGLGFSARMTHLASDGGEFRGINLFSGTAEYHFSRSKVQPFVLGGVCLVTGERIVTVAYGDEQGIYYEEQFVEDVSKIGMEFGVGVKVLLLGDSLSLQPEFRLIDTTPGSGLNLGIPLAGVSFAYHW